MLRVRNLCVIHWLKGATGPLIGMPSYHIYSMETSSSSPLNCPLPIAGSLECARIFGPHIPIKIHWKKLIVWSLVECDSALLFQASLLGQAKWILSFVEGIEQLPQERCRIALELSKYNHNLPWQGVLYLTKSWMGTALRLLGVLVLMNEKICPRLLLHLLGFFLFIQIVLHCESSVNLPLSVLLEKYCEALSARTNVTGICSSISWWLLVTAGSVFKVPLLQEHLFLLR